MEERILFLVIEKSSYDDFEAIVRIRRVPRGKNRLVEKVNGQRLTVNSYSIISFKTTCR